MIYWSGEPEPNEHVRVGPMLQMRAASSSMLD